MKSYWVAGHEAVGGVFRGDACFEVVVSEYVDTRVSCATVALFALEPDAERYAEWKNAEETEETA